MQRDTGQMLSIMFVMIATVGGATFVLSKLIDRNTQLIERNHSAVQVVEQKVMEHAEKIAFIKGQLSAFAEASTETMDQCTRALLNTKTALDAHTAALHAWKKERSELNASYQQAIAEHRNYAERVELATLKMQQATNEHLELAQKERRRIVDIERSVQSLGDLTAADKRALANEIREQKQRFDALVDLLNSLPASKTGTQWKRNLQKFYPSPQRRG